MNSSGRIIRLTETGSTNNYTSDLVRQSVTSDWTVVMADFQSKGRGQRGKGWISDPGENLLCSVYRKLTLASKYQFFISASVALGVCNYLISKGVSASLKWPNDVVIGGRKIAGMLIENHVAFQSLEQSIIGIGLNVNQTEFPRFHWSATSMKMETGRSFDMDEVLADLLESLKVSMSESIESTLLEYQKLVFGMNERCILKIGDDLIEGEIRGIDGNGALIMETNKGLKGYSNGSIQRIGSASSGFSPAH